MTGAARPPGNRLSQETSPYLLQHSRNPVEWYPWGPEALALAKAADRPIFLSIGYSACHWCHVMERESFEDEEIARRMNAAFVNVKVDREERPDLDEIYMKAVQALTGQGGWPMSVFLTPDLEPFFGGTYFPPRRAHGRQGFAELLESIERAWRDDRPNALRQGARLARRISDEARQDSRGRLDGDVLDRSLASLGEAFDPEWGGFGGAPKFPHAIDLRLLLRHHLRMGDPAALSMALLTLDRMSEGGIHDQLGGGFHRYSVDGRWLVPHFEKMLYDNALLVPAYLEAFVLTREERFATIAEATCAWALREMLLPEGGFASSQDADSDGEEGRFFVWAPEELAAVLGPRWGYHAAEWYGVTAEGTFEHGRSVLCRQAPAVQVAARLHLPLDELVEEMRRARPRLLEARARRSAPSRDDKVLASWNGLMISALAKSSQVLRKREHATAAGNAARFVLERMRQPDGRLFATFRAERAHVNACLDDYAFLVAGLLDLYETDFDPAWIREALALDAIVEARFEDSTRGGVFTTARDHERLIARLKSVHDGALPAGSGVHSMSLLRLAELTGRRDFAERAERAITSVAVLANSRPTAFSSLLTAVDFLAAGPLEVVVAGPPGDPAVEEMLAAVRASRRLQRVVAVSDSRADVRLLPLLEGRTHATGRTRAYVCRNYACGAPLRSAEELEHALAAAPRSGG